MNYERKALGYMILEKVKEAPFDRLCIEAVVEDGKQGHATQIAGSYWGIVGAIAGLLYNMTCDRQVDAKEMLTEIEIMLEMLQSKDGVEIRRTAQERIDETTVSEQISNLLDYFKNKNKDKE